MTQRYAVGGAPTGFAAPGEPVDPPEPHRGVVLAHRELPGGDLRRFGTLAGPLRPAPAAGVPYRVAYQRVSGTGTLGVHRVRPVLLALAAVVVETVFVVWLLWPGHLVQPDGSLGARVANGFVIASITLLELLRLLNVYSLALASLLVRDPVPVEPQRGLRVAFLTTIVPAKEPIEVVAETLRAACRIDYDGTFDVWILDEGDDPAVRELCAGLGVRHFTRKGAGHWNQPSGAMRAKTKHGNYNAWLDAHGDGYDVLVSVDPDHVPLPHYLDRVLGYFRDPDVAYVVGPQNYANSENRISAGAESQQFPFHTVIQRAANAYGAAMLVGTNNAIRVSALRNVGGLADSITEDMATGLALHSRRNPATGRRWTSVYTPDVLSLGEGPSTWTDYCSQQARWSRGTFEVVAGLFWRRACRLRPRQLLHYGLILTFYPSMALGWILGAVNGLLFLALGAKGIEVPAGVWLMLYVDAAAFQFALYVWNRRYNVSPHERDGSFGVLGMLMSVLSAPVYATQLLMALARRPATFVVTPKGRAASGDSWSTFRWHIQWAVLLAGALVAGVLTGRVALITCVWPLAALTICAIPPVWWLAQARLGERAGRTPEATQAVRA